MCESSEFDTVVYVSVTQNSEDYWIWLNMPQYALMSLNVPENGGILLDDPEYAWKFLNMFSICLIIWLDIWQDFEDASGICRYIVIIPLFL